MDTLPTSPYLTELKTRLDRLRTGYMTLGQVSGVTQSTRDGVCDAMRIVESQIAEETAKLR
jgi:hypothetical protein